MNETKWLESTKPRAMLRFLKGKVSERKLRLVAVAVHREYHRLDPRFSGPESGLAADTAEALADAGGSVDTATRLKLGGYFILNPTAYGAASRLVENADVPDPFKCSILRCIFGPLPFRTVPLHPSVRTWNDGLVRRLAEEAYQHRQLLSGHLDPQRLAVLAAAVEEAGGDTERVEHLRLPEPHARGCFVVDLLTGRQ
jgi:hypothetical protein